MIRLTAIALTLFWSATSAWAQLRQPVWDFWQRDDGTAVVYDCRACPEDEYIRVSCTPSSPRVTVTVLSVLVPEGLEKDAFLTMTFVTDGQEFRRAGIVGFSEFFGAMPVVTVPPDDPLLTAMATGSVLSVAIGQDRSDIPLNGSGAALEKLRVACGFAN